MLVSFGIYFILPLILSGTSYLISKKGLTNVAYFIEISYLSTIFAFFMGIRYDVGIDYFSYYDSYVNFSFNNVHLKNFEPFFYWLYVYGNKLNFSSHFIFFVSSFIQSFFYLLAFKHDKKNLPYAMFFLFTIMIFSYLNIIRQCTAYSILLVAYSNISRKEYKLGLLYIFLAFLFHNSSLICLGAFLFIFRKCFIDNWKIQSILLLVVLLVFSNNSTENIFNVLNRFLDNSFFSLFIKKRFSLLESERGSGIGVILKFIYYFIIIFLLRNKNDFRILFLKRIFLFGSILFGCFTYSIIFQRISMIFQITQLLLLPQLVYDFKFYWKNKIVIEKVLFFILIFIIVILYIASFLSGGQNCVPFKINFGEV